MLTLGWAGFGEFYSRCFNSVLKVTLISNTGLREVEIPGEQPSPSLTRIVLANRALLAPDGSGPIRNVDLPTATYWNATALIIALSLATWRRWRPLLAATSFGILVVQCFIGVAVVYALWNEGRQVELSAIAEGWTGFTDRLEVVLSRQASLVVPVLAWLTGLWIFRNLR